MITSKNLSAHIKPEYPFTAVVGQDKAKTALILSAIDPTIGGVLLSGPKGSGKSLLVRAFSQILPENEYVASCPFKCNPSDPTNMCPNCSSNFNQGKELDIAKEPMKIVQVPLSITDDMLIGSLDMERALEEGVNALKPGLLAEANQNILYIDEVNLLPDHITDCILDAVASGWNIIEREGISVQHPSRFMLIGTMNPEEGDLRPQILDRFGIYVETSNVDDQDLRAQIIVSNEDFARDPYSFIQQHEKELSELRSTIEAARILLPRVQVSEETHFLISSTCSRLRVDGFRPDIVSVRVAKAFAAFNGREKVAREDIISALELALGHRTRRSGLIPPPSPREIQRAVKKAERKEVKISLSGTAQRLGRAVLVSMRMASTIKRLLMKNVLVSLSLLALSTLSVTYIIDILRSDMTDIPSTSVTLPIEMLIGILLSVLVVLTTQRRKPMEEIAVGAFDLSKMMLQVEGRLTHKKEGGPVGSTGGTGEVRYGKGFTTTPDYGMKILQSIQSLQDMPRGIKIGRVGRTLKAGGYAGGKRMKTVSSSSRGRSAWFKIPDGRPRDIALVPTMKIAALRQHGRDLASYPRLLIKRQDIRVKVREYRAPFSIVLLVDMSMSMISSMRNLIEGIYTLHKDVYRQRDRIGLIVFKGSKAFTLQHPTANLDLVMKKFREVGASDFTPLAAGLFEAWRVLKQEKLRNRDAIPNLVVFSDGIVNVPLERPLSMLTRRKYHSESQADAFDVAHLIAKENFKVYVINTNHSELEARSPPIREEGWRLALSPTQFLMELARASKGTYHGLKLTESTQISGEAAARLFFT